ncbi:MAG: cbb3-type cytochrome c oxidase subunit I [Actinomycetota bacterium]|jgi:cytochrome c oxidase subunit 1|nr:cbb3-type cytochrome c oxidase subunit I [Actinomycetota bacterium]
MTATTMELGAGTTGYRPTATRLAHPWFSLNVITAFLGAAAGYGIGHWIGNYIASNYAVVQSTGQNNVAVVLALFFGVLGFIVGIGGLNYPILKMFGYQPEERAPVEDWTKYFRFSTDHKVVGKQYLVGVIGMFFIGGLFAMAIRTELTNPTTHFFAPDIYLQIVSEHGTIMMMMATSLVVGPLGNFLIPLMIGSRRMAFPRLEAISFWIFLCGLMVILTALPLGGFDTGWTGYAPLQTEAAPGMDAYLVGFGTIGTGMILNGFNQIVTIVNYRAPGMRWSRLPIFVWSMLATSFLLTLATPVLFVAGWFGVLDRTAQTAFYVNTHGGSSYLWENLFWFFGHPEVYIMAIPGFGLVGEMLPVFTRKPLFAYRVGAAGMFGVALLSFFVWQHHLFVSGINPDMRPVFMLTTELISIPTGFIYLIGMGTLWRAKIRFTVPMMFCLAMYFNFLIGGITGVYNSDVPVDVTIHGSFFVMAHFHYTIMGGLLFAFFGAVYYYTPLLTGKMLNNTLAKIHFWWMFIAFNFTFFPLFIVGFLGMPRRVFEYAPRLQVLNDWASASAYMLGMSFLVFAVNFVWSVWVDPKPAPANPWQSLGLEWQLPAYKMPWYNFERLPIILSDPYHYGEREALPVAHLQGVLALAGAGAGGGLAPVGAVGPDPGPEISPPRGEAEREDPRPE